MANSIADTPPLTILVAEDSATDRLLLKTMLSKQGHRVIEAADGVEALEILASQTPDMILLDALMPRMDGFEVAKTVKQQSSDHFIPIIFLTSLQEAGALARCLESGGDDVLTKPYDDTMLQAKIHAFVRMMDLHKTLEQQRDQIVEHNTRLLREQEVAKRVFDKVAHGGCLDADNIKYILSPISIFNGDVALAGVNGSGNLVILLGDFTGHGLAAAIGAMPLAQTFHTMIAKGFMSRHIISEINKKLHQLLPTGVFCCAVLAEFDFSEGLLSVWNGGLPPGRLLQKNTGNQLPIESRHLPLGILSPDKFDNAPQRLVISPGDKCYLWSDGIIEAENAKGEMYGYHQLEQVDRAPSGD